MLPGETIATGLPTVCPDCETSVLPLLIFNSGAGYYIGTRCPCAPVYSRESAYYRTEALAAHALADRSFGRGGIIAREVAAYWQPTAQLHGRPGRPGPVRLTVIVNDPLQTIARILDQHAKARRAAGREPLTTAHPDHNTALAAAIVHALASPAHPTRRH